MIKCASQRLFFIRLLKSQVNQEEICTAFNSLVRSILEYCAPLFIGLSKCNANKLEKILSRFHRLICGDATKHVTYTILKAFMNVVSRQLWNFFANLCRNHTSCTTFHLTFHLPGAFSCQLLKQISDSIPFLNKHHAFLIVTLWGNDLSFIILVSYSYCTCFIFVSCVRLIHVTIDFHFGSIKRIYTVNPNSLIWLQVTRLFYKWVKIPITGLLQL